jgi:hypothetical protein
MLGYSTRLALGDLRGAQRRVFIAGLDVLLCIVERLPGHAQALDEIAAPSGCLAQLLDGFPSEKTDEA